MAQLILNGSVKIFEDGIRIDRSLLKYTKIKNDKSNKNDINNSFNSLIYNDPDSITPHDYLYFKDEEGKDIIKNIASLKNIKDLMSKDTAESFNIAISSKLLKKDFIISTSLNSSVSNNDMRKIEKSIGLKRKFINFINKFKHYKENEKLLKINLLDLFKEVKIISGKEREFIDRLDSYKNLITKSIAMHQTSQTEELIEDLIVHVYESILAVNNYNHYITEEDLVELQNKCEKQLNLDYIENFTRVIPDSVVSKKVFTENFLVFDNYVVLHYDPLGKYFKLTEEEKRLKRDPILFGVISGSRKLYYIDSWEDEYCDLTWDKVVEKIGKDRML